MRLKLFPALTTRCQTYVLQKLLLLVILTLEQLCSSVDLKLYDCLGNSLVLSVEERSFALNKLSRSTGPVHN